MLTITDPWSTPSSGWRATNKEDGIVILTGTADSLWRAWAAHRRAKEQPEMRLDEMVDTFCRSLPPDCATCGQPVINPYNWPDLSEWRKVENMPITVWGPGGWACLHRRQISTDQHENERWMAAFVQCIPCNQYPRHCRQHFQEHLAAHPPDYSSQEAFFAWTVAAHNSVNIRSGKPQISADEARKLYD